MNQNKRWICWTFIYLFCYCVLECGGAVDCEKIQNWLRDVNSIEDIANYDKDALLKKLDGLSEIIGYDVHLSFYTKPSNRISEYVDLEKHLLEKFRYVHEQFTKETPPDVYNDMVKTLLEISNIGKLALTNKALRILVVQLCNPSVEERIETMLDSPNGTEAILSSLILGEACNRKSIPNLRKVFYESPSVSFKFDAAKSLLIMKDRVGADFLFQEAKKKGLYQRKAIRILTDNGELEDLRRAVSLLGDEGISEDAKLLIFDKAARQSPRLPNAIKNQLVGFYDRNQSLFLKTDESKISAICRLKDLGIPPVVERIAAFLYDKSPNVKKFALSLLGFLKADECVSSIVPFLDSENETVREYAIFSLENILLPGESTMTKPEFLMKIASVDDAIAKRKKWWKTNSQKYELKKVYRETIKENGTP